ncbi:MAG: peptidoglycan binding domain-containing protein [Chloroflexota bacterium]|nr:peptidoglycan binding domain-containing protein [Chloroflexota bacterium]
MTVAADRLRFPPAIATLRWGALGGAFVSTLAVCAGVAVGGAAAVTAAYDGRILPGVQVAGVDVAGLDRAAAQRAVRDALPSVRDGSLTLIADDARQTIEYAAFDRDYRIDAMLDDAFAAGRSGNLVEQALHVMRTLVHGRSVPPSVGYDEAALERLVATAAADMVTTPLDASVELDGDTFAVVPAVSGRRIDLEAAQRSVVEAIAAARAGDIGIPLSAEGVVPTVTTAEAERAAARANAMTAHEVTLTAGDDQFSVPASTLRAWIAFDVTAGDVDVTLRRDAITAHVSRLDDDVNRPPRDAGFYTDGAEITVIPSVDGRTLEVDASVDRIVEALEALRARSRAPSVALSIATVQPALTTEQAQAAVPQMQVISSWTTYFTPNPGDFWGENIAVPTRILDGYVVAPGAWFDFWTAVGPVTPERGYGPGGAIINGRSVPTGALGGGICSTSTTLFNAALRAGLEIGARTNHYYHIPRYPTGLDATVYMDDTSVVTMSFRNDTAYPIIIRGYYEYGVVRFDLLSVSTGRTVSFTDPIIRNERAARDEIEYTDELEPGVQERVEYPHDGMQVWVTRTVTDAAGALVHQEEYFSDYRVVNGIIREGTPEEGAPRPSPSPSPSPTAAP